MSSPKVKQKFRKMPSRDESEMATLVSTATATTTSVRLDTPHHCVPIEDEKLFTGKQLQMVKFHFTDGSGLPRQQEGVQKVKKIPVSTSSSSRRNLCTIGILKRQIMCDCLILVKQYRAPIKAYTLEFPAIVADSRGNFEDAVTKEISDDTGYTSTDIKHVSPLTAICPDITDAQTKLVSLLIDGDDPLQQPHPARCLSESHANSGNGNNEQSENGHGHGDVIEVLQVPVNGLLDRLKEFADQGLIIDSRVYAFAIGLKKGEKMAIAQFVPEEEMQPY